MKSIFALFFIIISSSAFAKGLPTAEYVDINRYIGKWYAISSLPQFYTWKCKGQTAEYKIINEQSISVKNTCIKARGKSAIYGQAVIENAATNAELVVTFNNFFTRLFRVRGDYTIIKLDPDYKYVIIGSQDRKTLWIMSRTPDMPEEIYDEYIAYVDELGFPVEKLKVSSKF